MYDFIIVGAGSAGCVLAERLTADGRHKVLLIEEGGPGDGWLVRMPKGFGKLLINPETTHFLPTQFTREGSNQPEIWVRGKMLGGSSGVNGMVWNRGQKADYDRLGELAGEPWSWSSMRPHLLGIEDHAMGADESRGVGGPIKVKDHPAPNKLITAFLEAGRQTGLPVKTHHHQDEQEGIGTLQWNIDKRGRRVSAARGFLGKARGRSNLTIVSGVRIDRIEVEEGRAVAVVGVSGGEPVRYAVRGEIILSAGAIGSPRILQLSGIGPGAALERAGIPVILEHPGIGHNLHEHWLLMQHFRLRDAKYSNNASFSGLPLLVNLARHLLFGTGPLSMGSSEAAAFVRLLPDADRPDTQIMFAPYSLDMAKQMAFEKEPGLQIYSFPLRPRSEGSVLVASADATAPMAIDPHYHSDDHDRRAAVASVRFIRKLMAQPALASFIVDETAATAGAETDEEILRAYRRYGQAGYHAVGTVAMGRENTPLDGRLRLRGIAALRVADCSVFPEMIAGNTNAATMAMASRAAALILEDLRG